MWNKDQAPGAGPGMENFINSGARIGPTMRIKGEIYSSDEIQVDGEIDGTVASENRLTIGESGKVDASIKATEVVVGGAVKGDVEATQRIVLRKGANLVGDVRTAGIVIEDGAYFRGGIDITRPAASQAGN